MLQAEHDIGRSGRYWQADNQPAPERTRDLSLDRGRDDNGRRGRGPKQHNEYEREQRGDGLQPNQASVADESRSAAIRASATQRGLHPVVDQGRPASAMRLFLRGRDQRTLG